MTESPNTVTTETVLLFRRQEMFHALDGINYLDGQLNPGERYATWRYIVYLERYIERQSSKGLV